MSIESVDEADVFVAVGGADLDAAGFDFAYIYFGGVGRVEIILHRDSGCGIGNGQHTFPFGQSEDSCRMRFVGCKVRTNSQDSNKKYPSKYSTPAFATY